MCGIYGIKKGNEIDLSLLEQNQKRGKVSLSSFETPNGKFYHFRAPTSGCDLNNLSEAYPLTYKGWGLIGNGVINESFFKSIKDEENNNDLYYILKGIVNEGFQFLEKVEGCFALTIFSPSGQIYLIKNTFPLYCNGPIFSSVKFEGSELLEDGNLLNWTDDKLEMKLKLKESPFMI